MTERVEIYDRFGSVIRVMHRDRQNVNAFAAEIIEDCEPYLDAVKEERENMDTRKSHYRPIAHIPVHVTERAMREGWYNDKKAWKRWLNDSDNKHFRIWEGNV